MKMKVIISSFATLALAMPVLQAATTFSSITATGAPSSQGWTTTALGTGGDFFAAPGWGIYNGIDTSNETESVYNLAGGALSVGQTISISFTNNTITPGEFVGIDFRESGVPANTGTTGIGFNFQGGGANYQSFSNAGVADTGVGYTSAAQTITLTNVDGTNYTLSVGGTPITSLNLANSTTGIDQIRVFNGNGEVGGADVIFNDLAVTPEPSGTILAGLGLLLTLVRRRKQ